VRGEGGGEEMGIRKEDERAKGRKRAQRREKEVRGREKGRVR
jgi:hypothetical protein